MTTVSGGELLLNKSSGVAVGGDVTINGGTLTLGTSSQIASTSDVTLSSGTFDLSDHHESISSLTFQAGTLSQGTGALTLSSASTALTMRNVTITGDLVVEGNVAFDNTN